MSIIKQAPAPGFPTLHHLESSQSLKILWALEELDQLYNVGYGLIVYERSLNATELRKISPLGFSPILTVPQAKVQKDKVILESRLILNYIHKTFGKDVWTPDEEDVDRDEFFQEFGQNTFNQRVGFAMALEAISQGIPLFLFFLKPLFWVTLLPIAKLWLSNYVSRIFLFLEDALTDSKPFFSGNKFGKADILMTFPVDVSVQRGYLDEKKYPKLHRWHRTCHERPAFKRALDKGGRYNLKSF
ncbi:glutathione S-transferase [Acrasis kona]|uniref:Glutathione S-transferase n=1 Tax=Acrasis kona TaxID=1008807 RepID=A0AAW2ZIW2_9EUKA